MGTDGNGAISAFCIQLSQGSRRCPLLDHRGPDVYLINYLSSAQLECTHESIIEKYNG